MAQPFRFGVQVSNLAASGWADEVRRIESLGYDALYVPDHFGPQWDPIAFCAAAAAVSTTLRIGTLVYDVDYRHPVVHAKAAATCQVISGGRHIFGLGAGWMRTDYDEAGIAYDTPGVRIARLDEALQICRSMWAHAQTSFDGTHYTLTNIAAAVEGLTEPPTVLVGGGGKKVLSLAGRHADIVGINPSLHEGMVTPATAADLAPERVREKIGWVRDAAAEAGRDPDSLEFQTLAFIVAVGADATDLRNGLATATGLTPEQVADCPLFLTGTGEEVRERLEAQREATGISHIVAQLRTPAELENFAEHVVAPLAGT